MEEHIKTLQEINQRQKFRVYLHESSRSCLNSITSSELSGLGRYFIPRPMRPAVKMVATKFLEPFMRLRAHRILDQRSIKLHLGCGAIRISNWVNIGLVGNNADIFWDLRNSLPFPEGSVEAIFHEHFLEHLTLEGAYLFTRECARLIRPRGILRIGVPDFGRYAKSYIDNTDFIEQARPGRPTRMLALSEVAYWYEHKSIWDAETLLALISEFGFRDARVCEFGDSSIDPAPDSEHRKGETLYIEAVR